MNNDSWGDAPGYDENRRWRKNNEQTPLDKLTIPIGQLAKGHDHHSQGQRPMAVTFKASLHECCLLLRKSSVTFAERKTTLSKVTAIGATPLENGPQTQLANGHNQHLNIAVGQMIEHDSWSWGDAPGYVEHGRWP